jgi:hypothetical protein
VEDLAQHTPQIHVVEKQREEAEGQHEHDDRTTM